MRDLDEPVRHGNRARQHRACRTPDPALYRRTPVIEISGSDLRLDVARLVLKLELMQHTGSFKPRSAFTNLLTLEVPSAGVVAASGGNHGAAVAFAARTLGKPATIFVPRVTPAAKRDRIAGYGARLVVSGESYAEALTASEQWAKGAGALRVHASDQVETLLGQWTVALELEQQDPGLDTLLVAVGGGGLIGGIAAWYAGGIRLIGVEPEAAPTLENALRAGRPVDTRVGGIAADSLSGGRVGDLMFPLAQAYVNRVVLVSDDDILEAQWRLWDVLRIAAEPGGASALAALLSGSYRPGPDERVGVLVCGGNAALPKIAACERSS
jgi:threonine dehydratase